MGRDGKPADAAGQFREAVRIMPDLPEARFNLAMALVNEGDYSEALSEFDKVLEQHPTNAMALNYAQALRQKLSLHTTALSLPQKFAGLKNDQITKSPKVLVREAFSTKLELRPRLQSSKVPAPVWQPITIRGSNVPSSRCNNLPRKRPGLISPGRRTSPIP